MLTAMIGYLMFVVIKSNRYYKKLKRSRRTKHFEFVLLGMLIGFLVGVFGSSLIVDLIFTDNFLKVHQSPDVGLFGFYYLATLILMVIFSILSVIIYNIVYKSRA